MVSKLKKYVIKIVNAYPFATQFVSDQHKSQTMCVIKV